MIPMAQTRTDARMLFPRPENGALVEETPPCLSWIGCEGTEKYTVRLYEGDRLIWQGETENTYTVPDFVLPAGEYGWEVQKGEHLRERQTFRIAENAVPIHRVDAKTLLSGVPGERPRHLFTKKEIPAILASHPAELETLRRNIALALSDGLPQAPAFHYDENALPYREYFGRYRDFCDRDLVACALGWALMGDEKAAEHGVRLLMTVCTWNPDGPCSLNSTWGDEIGLSNARCLPAVVDLLWDRLDASQRAFVCRTVAAYGYQCETRLRTLDYCRNPGDSHAGRVPAYLGEAALVLKGTDTLPEEVLERWLGYALEIYGGIFPHYGGTDGGWAEGVFYAGSYTKWYLPFFSAVERFSDCCFLHRPFYQRLSQFFLHFASPLAENHPFGDGYWCRSEDAEWPGFYAQSPCRVYGERFGPEETAQRARDAASPEIFRLHLLDVFLPKGKQPPVSLTGKAENLRHFADTGLVSMHTDLFHGEKDIFCLIRASRFGSDSHRHADQGSFALFCGGTALISPSGYFGRAYGTAHHFGWTNTTRAHNAILLDGMGQYEWSEKAVGRILECRETAEGYYASADMTGAYPVNAGWKRSWLLTRDGVLTVTDEVESRSPVRVDWPLHFLSQPKAAGDTLTVERGGVKLTVTPEAGCLTDLTLSDKFGVELNEGVPEPYRVTMPPQYHAMWSAPPARHHSLRVVFRIERVSEI